MGRLTSSVDKINELKKMSKVEFAKFISEANSNELKGILKKEGYKISKKKKSELIELIYSLVDEATITYSLEEEICNKAENSMKALQLVYALRGVKATKSEIIDRATKDSVEEQENILKNNISKIDKINKNKIIIDEVNAKLEYIKSNVRLLQDVYIENGKLSERLTVAGGSLYKRIWELSYVTIPVIKFNMLDDENEEEGCCDKSKIYIFDGDCNMDEFELFDKDIVDFKANEKEVMYSLMMLEETKILMYDTDNIDIQNRNYSIDFYIEIDEFINDLNILKNKNYIFDNRKFKLDIEKLVHNEMLIKLNDALESVENLRREWD